jgi:CheY-like chemotaxis protein
MRCETILIVEDDRDIREALRLVLEAEGYCVRVADNGRDGLAMLGETRGPCLILLDLMMPVMDGFQFLSVRERDVALATIPVVVVSAFPENARDIASMTQGFVKKPVNLEQLLAVAQRYCGAPAGPQAESRARERGEQ